MDTWDHSRLAYADLVPVGELAADCTVIEQQRPAPGRLDRTPAAGSPAVVVSDELAARAAAMELTLV